LRDTVEESLGAVVALVATFKDIRFLLKDETNTLSLWSVDRTYDFVIAAWDGFSKGRMEFRARQDAVATQLPPDVYTRDLNDLYRVGSLVALI
jgi:hypothetical protein